MQQLIWFKEESASMDNWSLLISHMVESTICSSSKSCQARMQGKLQSLFSICHQNRVMFYETERQTQRMKLNKLIHTHQIDLHTLYVLLKIVHEFEQRAYFWLFRGTAQKHCT